MFRLGWRSYLAAGATLAAAYYLTPPAVAKLAVWPAAGLSSVVAIIAGVRRHRPAAPLAWWLFAAGQLAFTLGDWLYVLRARRGTGMVFPSAVDVFYLVFYPLMILGLVLLIRRRSPGRDGAALTDAAIITVGLGVVSWVLLIGPYIRLEGFTPGQRLVAVAYPLADVLLLAVTTRAALGAGRRPPAWWLLAGSITPLLVGDTVFGLQQLAGTWGTWQTTHPIDLSWIAFWVCWGAAALHPSMVELSESATSSPRLTRGRLVLLAAASLIPAAVLAEQTARGAPMDVWVIVPSAVALPLLALSRAGSLASALAVERERRRASQAVLRRTEEDRTRMAHDVHDQVLPNLMLLDRELATTRKQLAADDAAVEAHQSLAEAQQTLSGAIAQVRAWIAQLRPPQLGQRTIRDALEHQAATFRIATGVACQVEANVDGALSSSLETLLYLITQEALANVARHAQATHVSIALMADTTALRLRIHDNGVGFDPVPPTQLLRHGHYGLVGMRGRVEMVGGQLTIDTAPGSGTTITAVLPRRQG